MTYTTYVYTFVCVFDFSRMKIQTLNNTFTLLILINSDVPNSEALPHSKAFFKVALCTTEDKRFVKN